MHLNKYYLKKVVLKNRMYRILEENKLQETDKNKRLVYLDILNILSIFVVVAMHMNGSVHSLPLNKSWTFSLLVNTLCYFAVPIFVMISGATLMNYRQKYDTKTFFKKD